MEINMTALNTKQYDALKKLVEDKYREEEIQFDTLHGPFEDPLQEALKGNTGHVFESIAIIWNEIITEEEVHG
jgi:hypothetical protein